MAKLTGQFTTPSFDASNNKTHKAFLHGVVFVFTGATKITRESDDKGKYNFDLANGEYEVSVYLKGSAEKDRFDMRAGEKFTVTASTPADALEKWLQVIGDNGKDEVATYYENLLAQMQKVANDFKKDTEFVGNAGGRIMREGAGGILSNGSPSVPSGHDMHTKIPNGLYRLPAGLINSVGWQRSGDSGIMNGWGSGYWSFLIMGANGDMALLSSNNGNVREPNTFLGTKNTIIDSNGNLKAASPVLRLFNDRIETNDQFTEKPFFEKIGSGKYKISSTLGLAQEGWTYEKPRGSDGQPYFRIKVEKLDDGCIISVHDEYIDYEDVEIIDEKGKARTVKEKVTVLSAPRDIKDHERWIDLRFHEEPQEHHEEELLAEY